MAELARISHRVVGLSLLVLCGCDCGSDKAVPFKRPTAEAAKSPPATAGDAGKAEAGLAHAGQRYLAAPSRIALPNGEIDRGSGQIHASLSLDPGGEQVLLLSVDDDGALQLERSALIDGAYTKPARVRTLPVALTRGQRCEVLSGGLDGLSAAHVLATARLSCVSATGTADSDATGPPAPAPTVGAATPDPSATAALASPDDPRVYHLHWVLSRDRAPRVLEQLHLAPAPGATTSGLGVQFGATALDDDDHPDLQAVLHVAAEQTDDDTDGGHDFTLQWLNRPSGLARKDEEPEATLLAQIERARALVRRRPERALELAGATFALHRRLCREGEATELFVSGQPGMPCGKSLAFGRAKVVQIMALARTQRPLQAIARYEELDGPGLRLLPIDRKRAKAAIDGLPRLAGYSFTRGPVLSPVQAPALHRPRVAFLDESRLLLRGAPNETYDLGTGHRAPAGIASGLAWQTPDGRWTATEIFRDCDGYHVLLVPSDQVVGNVVAKGGARSPLVVPVPAPTGQACPLTGSARQDSGGLRVLDFAPQGLLLSRGSQILRLAVTSDGEAPQPAQPVPAGAPLPRSSHATTLARATRAFALASPAGIAVIGPSQIQLIDTSQIPGAIDTVSLSPSGRKLAVLQGRQVWIGQQRPAMAPEKPPTATTTAPPPAP